MYLENNIGGVTVSMLASSVSPSWVNPKVLNLVFVVSPLTQH